MAASTGHGRAINGEQKSWPYHLINVSVMVGTVLGK